MKYIIDIPTDSRWIEFYSPINGERNHFKGTAIGIDQMEIYVESDRKAIEDEVWRFAKIFMDDMGVDDLEVVNGDTIKRYFAMTYQEAKAKYEAWKKKKEEIHVGDEVVYHGNKYVVGYVGADEVYHIIDQNWIRVVVQGRYQIFKTGRHFDEVKELLRKMRGKRNE